MTQRSVNIGTIDDANSSVASILNTNVLMTLSTVSTLDGVPRAWANTAYFAWTPEPRLYFLSEPSSQHSRNLIDNDSVAITVFDSHQTGEGGKLGLQIVGRCSLATEDVLATGLRAYQQRFSGFETVIAEPADFDREIIASKLYIVEVNLVKIFDEARYGEEVWVEMHMSEDVSTSDS